MNPKTKESMQLGGTVAGVISHGHPRPPVLTSSLTLPAFSTTGLAPVYQAHLFGAFLVEP